MITISELAKEYGIHRNTMHRILKDYFPSKKPYVLINPKLGREIREKFGKGKFVRKNTIYKKYGLSSKTFIRHLKKAGGSSIAYYEVFMASYSKKFFTSRQQYLIFKHLGKPKSAAIKKKILFSIKL
jgi:hypothetical protein